MAGRAPDRPDVTPHIVALATHVRTVPAAERTAFAARLRDVGEGILAIETCHRVEGYLTLRADAVGRIGRELGLPDGGRVLVGPDAVRHAVAVAVGRDSVVVGEDQILHQLRLAIDGARAGGDLSASLERLFAVALQAGRRARSWRNGPSTSLADVALAVIVARAGSIRGRRVLIVGAGRMGRLAARTAVAAGAVVSVANRSSGGARDVASEVGGTIEAFDPGLAVRDYAAAVVAIGGPWSLGTATIETLAAGSTILVDLSVPGAIPATIGDRLGERWNPADTLAGLAVGDASADDRAAARMDLLIEDTTAEIVEWLEGHHRRATADVLRRRVEQDREAELAALWRRLPDLEPDAREAIARMTLHLTDGLIREPLERLRRDRDGRDEQAIRDLFAL